MKTIMISKSLIDIERSIRRQVYEKLKFSCSIDIVPYNKQQFNVYCLSTFENERRREKLENSLNKYFKV